MKLAALKQLGEVREAAPERFLYDFVLDKTFDVMRVAYLAMRRAVARPPRDSVETKVFPHFPQVKDEEVVLPSMRAIQQRVQAWWAEWVAERRALLKAKASSMPDLRPRSDAVIDLHAHVLPGLDDGARDLEEALAMLRLAQEDGTTRALRDAARARADLRGRPRRRRRGARAAGRRARGRRA